MHSNTVSKFSLSYYSLITQIIIINLLSAFIGLIFVGFFNLFLFNNNKNIQIKIDQINSQINDITDYLEKNAIIRIPQFNEESGEIIFSSELHLDPFASQLYIENKYLNQTNVIKIYNSDLIKYVDTKDLYLGDEVIEIDIEEKYQKPNYFNRYKNLYLNLFSNLQKYFDIKKMKEMTETSTNDINLIIELIKKQDKISKVFSYENNNLSFNILNPLIKKNNIYGAVFITGFLTQESSESAMISYNLFNLYLIIIFIMFLLSIFFTRSIIRPIKTLSFLAKIEQNKKDISSYILKYPIRNDEIGGLSDDIKNMSTKLKSRINELEKFTADVAHELKNPLASLKTSNELLSNNKIKSQDRKKLFNNTIKDLDRMNRLISEISEYTRTHVEVEKQKFEQLEIIKFIKNLKSSFNHNRKNIKILLNFTDIEVMLQANIDKLAQVFINLIENAISFSPKESNILIHQEKENNTVIIYIADQGKGIDNKLKDKIFQRFYTDRINKKNFHTGLGLSISRKIMESFGGSLVLSDKIIDNYNGACFKLSLPIED